MSRFVYGVNPVLEALKAHHKDVMRVMLERGKEGRRSQGADRVAQAAAGALEHCPVVRVTNLSRALEQMKEQGIWTVALAGEGDKDLRDIDLTAPTALVLGSEGSGVRPLVRKTCDHLARIPIAGQVVSLNVSAAGAVALYEVARQRAARK